MEGEAGLSGVAVGSWSLPEETEETETDTEDE